MEPEPIEPGTLSVIVDDGSGAKVDPATPTVSDDAASRASELKSQATELLGQFGSLIQRDLARIRASLRKRDAGNS